MPWCMTLLRMPRMCLSGDHAASKPLPADDHHVSAAWSLLISSPVFTSELLHSIKFMRTWFALRSGSQGAAVAAARQESTDQECLNGSVRNLVTLPRRMTKGRGSCCSAVGP
jgi:hypothetical protein